MLTKPNYGWSDFQLEGTSIYGLSYLDDVAFDWVNQAINGLETLLPFCVKGFMEPNRFLCMVSYWNCYVIREGEDRYQLKEDEVSYEYSHTSMLQFCQYLYDDISQNISEWASFPSWSFEDTDKEKKKRVEQLEQRLEKLKELMSKKEESFSKNCCFL